MLKRENKATALYQSFKDEDGVATIELNIDTYPQIYTHRTRLKIKNKKFSPRLINRLFILSTDFFQYPENRRLKPEAVQELYEHLAFKVKVGFIKDHIASKYGVHLRDYDISNYKQRWKKEVTSGRTEEQLLNGLINNIMNDDEGSKVEVVVSEEGVAEIIFLQTSTMRALLRKYPTVLFVDSTYKTNDRSMPLFSIMVVDGNRHGQVVAHALIVNELTETLTKVLEAFVRYSDVELETVKTVIIDKDASELNAISTVLPNVAIIICKFHLKQAIERKIKHFPYQKHDNFMTLVLNKTRRFNMFITHAVMATGLKSFITVQILCLCTGTMHARCFPCVRYTASTY